MFNLNWFRPPARRSCSPRSSTAWRSRYCPRDMARTYARTLRARRRRRSLTIAAMLALGYTARYSGQDAILGPRVRAHGRALPVLRHAAGLARRRADRLGHLVERLFGSLQTITARQVGVSETLYGGGEQLRRRDGQDDRRAEHRRREHRDALVRARVAILRYVFRHSIALAALVGIWSCCRRTSGRSRDGGSLASG